jgi:hypothetical protein
MFGINTVRCNVDGYLFIIVAAPPLVLFLSAESGDTESS